MKAIARRNLFSTLFTPVNTFRVARMGQLRVQNSHEKQISMLTQNQRMFFSKKKDTAAKEESSETTKDEGAEVVAEEANENQETEKKSDEKTSSSSSESEEIELTTEDIKKIKDLIKEQDQTIDDQTTKIEELGKQAKDLKQKLIYQIAENDNTVKRYRKQIEDGKQFAISKFAKELLDVRDSLELALQHCNEEKIEGVEEIKKVKELYLMVVKGQRMNSELMDKILAKFEVNQFSPMGEKFDPNIHEAVFVIPEMEGVENDHVGNVMQSGWKIGERVLRAAKVGIVKK